MLRNSLLQSPEESEAKTIFDLISEKTGCSSAEELLDRLQNSVKLADSLRSHQILADSKLAQLRTEHNELYG